MVIGLKKRERKIKKYYERKKKIMTCEYKMYSLCWDRQESFFMLREYIRQVCRINKILQSIWLKGNRGDEILHQKDVI